MDPHAEMILLAEHDAAENLAGLDWRISFLAGVAAGEETIAREIGEDEAMGADPGGGPGDDYVADPQPTWCYVFDSQRLAILDSGEHTVTASLKPDVMAAGQQSPAQLLE